MLSYVFQFLTPSSYLAEAPESLLSKQILEELQQISGIELKKCAKSLHNFKGYLNCFISMLKKFSNLPQKWNWVYL